MIARTKHGPYVHVWNLKKKYIMLQETGSQSASLIADIKDDKIKFRCKMLFT